MKLFAKREKNPVNRSLKIMQIRTVASCGYQDCRALPGKREKALISCEALWRSVSGVNVEQLIRAALAGEDEIAQYLEGTAYAKGAQALRESASAFERWCDNRMIEMLKPQKYEAFSVGPLLGYLIARETEIKTVRIILTGKQNGFSDEAIRERIREMYV